MRRRWMKRTPAAAAATPSVPALSPMKMQSTVYAPAAGKVVEVLVGPGDQVEAKDLLVVLE